MQTVDAAQVPLRSQRQEDPVPRPGRRNGGAVRAPVQQEAPVRAAQVHPGVLRRSGAHLPAGVRQTAQLRTGPLRGAVPHGQLQPLLPRQFRRVNVPLRLSGDVPAGAVRDPPARLQPSVQPRTSVRSPAAAQLPSGRQLPAVHRPLRETLLRQARAAQERALSPDAGQLRQGLRQEPAVRASHVSAYVSRWSLSDCVRPAVSGGAHRVHSRLQRALSRRSLSASVVQGEGQSAVPVRAATGHCVVRGAAERLQEDGHRTASGQDDGAAVGRVRRLQGPARIQPIQHQVQESRVQRRVRSGRTQPASGPGAADQQSQSQAGRSALSRLAQGLVQEGRPLRPDGPR